MRLHFSTNDYLITWNLLFGSSFSETVHTFKQRLYKTYRNQYNHLSKDKDEMLQDIKNFIQENLFNNKDVYKTSVETERQDELFEYANVPSYMKQPIKSNYREEIDKDDDFDIGF